MKRFPKGAKRVSPLYATNDPIQQIDQRTPHRPASKSVVRPNFAFIYRSALTVIRSNMYEPVSDRCVTTIIKPKYVTGGGFESTDEVEYNDRKTYSSSDLVPPEKPPRKNKFRRKLSKKESCEGAPAAAARVDNGNNKMRPDGDACVDIDHITIEASNNYKNKFSEASVQTSPLIPYRLRFWPKCDLKCDPEEKGCTKLRLTCCCRVLSQWILSQIGLTIVVISWALLGAFAFYKTEGPRELEQSAELAQLQTDLSVELATDLRQTDKHQEGWSITIHNYMQKHEGLLLDAVSAGFGEGGGGSIWTYPGCILFAVSLLTTLGFGAPVPRTSLGRGAAVLFSAIGIPLHFLLILNMGNLGAIKLQRLAFRTSLTDIPSPPRPKWLQWFPFASIAFYYLMGVALFGFARQRPAVDSFMFPLDFTAAGGVATTCGHIRILYALYLEFAVTLAALVVSLIQASATRGIVDIGLRWGLLTNT